MNKHLFLLASLLTINLSVFLIFRNKVQLEFQPEKYFEVEKTLGTSIQSAIPAISMDINNQHIGIPTRLTIPSINIDTNIQQVGITPDGYMGVPTNSDEVGWYKHGPRPGERGSAVIAGHLNGSNGDNGVFIDLNKLKEGDKIYVEHESGKFITFKMLENRSYDKGFADEVFTRSDGTYLNLITCEGYWNEAEKSYSKRLVVFTEIAK